MREDLVLDDGRVIDEKDVLDGHGGDLGYHDAAQRVGDRWVHPHQVELHRLVRQPRDLGASWTAGEPKDAARRRR